MKKIELTKNRVALVDDQDFEELNKYKWAYHHRGYAIRMEKAPYKTGKRRFLLMHREILGDPHGMLVDHKNHNGLDNRRSNLRACTDAENMRNRLLQKNNKSGFQGVSKSKSGWVASIRYGGMYPLMVQALKSAEEAAYIYDQLAVQLHGKFATTNGFAS